MDPSLSHFQLIGTPQASAGYASAMVLAIKIASWLNAEGLVNILFHLLMGVVVLVLLIMLIHRMVNGLRKTLGLPGIALLAAVSVYLSVAFVTAIRGGSFHLFNGVLSPWTATLCVAVFGWVIGIEKATDRLPDADPAGPPASSGYANVTTLRFIALAILALPVTYTLVAHNVVSGRGVMGVPMPDRGSLDAHDPDTYLFRTWTMRVLANRQLQVPELQALGMSSADAAFLSDPTKAARTQLTDLGVPSFLAGSILQAGTLLSGDTSLTQLSGFTFVGLNRSNFSFLQGFLLGSVPGLSCLFAVLGFWLLLTSGLSQPDPVQKPGTEPAPALDPEPAPAPQESLTP